MSASTTNFTLIINVANEQPFTPGEFPRVETGPYMGVIAAVSLTQQKADPADPQKILKNNLVLEIAHNMADPNARPDYKEIKHKVYLYNPEVAALQKGEAGYDQVSARLTRMRLRTLLESIGAKPEQLDANSKLPVPSSLFVGKQCFFFVNQPPKGELDVERSKVAQKPVLKYADIDFLTPKEYAKRLAAQAATSAAGGATQASSGVFTPQTVQPTVGGSLAALLGGGGAPNGATAATGVGEPLRLG
jgi:hypothetical protein